MGAMKQSMKQGRDDLATAQEELKSMRAVTHALGLEVEKLKAQADGYQHQINSDAKEGKNSPQAEVKLQYTMDSLKTEQAREAHRRGDIKKLDGEMTRMGVGRRRRAVADKTHVAANDPAKIKMKMPQPKMISTEGVAGGRRRRSKARLMAEYMKDISQSAGTGETMIPGVPLSLPVDQQPVR